MEHGKGKQHGPTKTAKVVGLFMAAVLAAGASGCSSPLSRHKHIDRNKDGYCDEDGQPMTSGSSSGSRWYHWSHYYGGSSRTASGTVNSHSSKSGISSGAKGGVGSHAGGGSG